MAIPSTVPGINDLIRGQIIQTSEDVLKPPPNIIRTVQAAKTIYFVYRNDHLKRIELYSQIEGLIAGNPPYSPIELAKNRLQHIANFNDLSARAMYEEGANSYWNLINESANLVKFNLKLGSENDAKWAEIMAEHWSNVVRTWKPFTINYNTLCGQLVKFGVSPVIWPDELDWRWKTVELQRFFVEDQAQSDISLLTAICVETIFTAQYLYEVYDQIKDLPEQSTPWNVTELSKLLVFLANSFNKTQQQPYIDMMQIQRHIQNGDLTFQSIFTDSIRLVSLFYQEYDGKVSHYMFHPYYDWGELLFFADRQYECMEEGILIFTASPGEFTIHSNRGLGHKIFSSAQAMMQLSCSTVDMGRMAATPIVQTLQTGSKDADQIRFYPGVATNIGTATLQENRLGANLPGVIQLMQFMEQRVRNNLGISGTDPRFPDTSEGSIAPSEARMRSYKEFAIPKNNIAHFYKTLDRVYYNMVAKMLHAKEGNPGYEYVKKWKTLCLDDGVPPEAFATKTSERHELPDHLSVASARVAGDGSTVGKIMGLQEIAPIVGTFGPKGRATFQRESVLASFGPDYIDAFLSDSQVADEQQGGASLAAVENAIMMLGQSPVFSYDNEQEAHFSTHLALGTHIIQSIQQQQMTAVDADKVFMALIPHMGEHWKALQESVFEKGYIEQTKDAWNQLAQYARLNRKNAGAEIQAQIRKQQEQQAAGQAAMTDEQIKNMKAQGDEKRADFKIQAQTARADKANQTRAEIMQEKVQKDAENQRLKISLEHGNNVAKTQNELATNTLAENRTAIANINGATPSPFDFETPKQ